MERLVNIKELELLLGYLESWAWLRGLYGGSNATQSGLRGLLRSQSSACLGPGSSLPVPGPAPPVPSTALCPC